MSPSIPGPEISKAVRNNAAHGQTLHRAGGQLRQRQNRAGIAIARTQRARVPEGRIALVDLDIVNPYFRSAEQHALLEAEGIEVFMPSFAMSTVDIPALPAQIRRCCAALRACGDRRGRRRYRSHRPGPLCALHACPAG